MVGTPAKKRWVPGDKRATEEFFKYVWADQFDWTSQHFEDTPKRFITMLRDLTEPDEFEFTTFKAHRLDEMITVGPIDFVSCCAHHILPFMGQAYVGYVPNDKIAGLSKFARLVKTMARTLTVQEELTKDIGARLLAELEPKGVALIMRAEHLCMTIRGVQSPGTITTTSFMDGVFSDHSRLARAEFMQFVQLGDRRG